MYNFPRTIKVTTYLFTRQSITDSQHCFIGLVLLHSATKAVNDSSGLIHFLMCFFLCPATEESDRMSESGGYLRFDNFFNCLHFNGNHHQLKTYGEFLLFLVFPNFLKKVVICQQKQIVFKFTYSLLLLHINRNRIQSKKNPPFWMEFFSKSRFPIRKQLPTLFWD